MLMHVTYVRSVCWTLFKSASIWDSFNLDCILHKGDLFYKSPNYYRYLGMWNNSNKKEYEKSRYEENREPKGEYEKTNMRKILNQNENMKKKKKRYKENPEPKREYVKTNMRKILNQNENRKKQI